MADERSGGSENLNQAILLALKEDAEGVIREARLALERGLTGKDQVLACAVLGSSLLALSTERPSEDLATEGVDLLERALSLDANGQDGQFHDPLQRAAWLTRLPSVYLLRSRAEQEAKGVDAAIRYLESKLTLFEYLAGAGAVPLYLELGNLHHACDRREQTRRYWERSLKTPPISPEDQLDAEAKRMARHNLDALVGNSPAIAEGPGEKRFRGSRKVVLFLGALAAVSLLMIPGQPLTGLLNLCVWGGILGLYVWRKHT